MVADYFHRVDKTMNVIRGFGEDVADEVVVKKVLRSVTSKYDRKVSSIEEAKDLETFSMDELFVSLTPYKMRTTDEETSKREVAFNSIKKGK